MHIVHCIRGAALCQYIAWKRQASIHITRRRSLLPQSWGGQWVCSPGKSYRLSFLLAPSISRYKTFVHSIQSVLVIRGKRTYISMVFAYKPCPPPRAWVRYFEHRSEEMHGNILTLWAGTYSHHGRPSVVLQTYGYKVVSSTIPR